VTAPKPADAGPGPRPSASDAHFGSATDTSTRAEPPRDREPDVNRPAGAESASKESATIRVRAAHGGSAQAFVHHFDTFITFN
jgi:hypothetical protein